MQIQEVLTAPRSPRQNPFAERLIGSTRGECLNHVLVLSERHLRNILIGLPLPLGAHHVIPKVRLLLEAADSGVPGLLRPALAAAVQEIREIDTRIRAVEQQLEVATAQALSVRQLRTIPGIGLLTATALVAAVGDVQRFPSARHFASYPAACLGGAGGTSAWA
jgi:transposase